MRPIYETEADRSRQHEVATYIETNYNCRFIPNPPLDPIDGTFVERTDDCPEYENHARAIAGVEIKTRKNPSNKYPTYLLSEFKWKAAKDYTETYAVPCLLAVQFTDGVFVTKLRDGYAVAPGGRIDRNDPKDIEMCVYIPMEEFKKI